VIERRKKIIEEEEGKTDVMIHCSESEVVKEDMDLISIKSEGYADAACSIQ
jgi:hypothetical protein